MAYNWDIDDKKPAEALNIVDRLLTMIEKKDQELEFERGARRQAEYEAKEARLDKGRLDVENAAFRTQLNELTIKYNNLMFDKAVPFGVDYDGNKVDPLSGQAAKIPTIKLFRETFNTGLKEAKDVVDKWQDTGAVVFK